MIRACMAAVVAFVVFADVAEARQLGREVELAAERAIAAREVPGAVVRIPS